MRKEQAQPIRRGEVKMRGATLKGFRKKAGLSQAGLAAKATQHLEDQGLTGISESLVALIETNRRQPSLINAAALAVVLDVDLDALAELTLEPEAVGQ